MKIGVMNNFFLKFLCFWKTEMIRVIGRDEFAENRVSKMIETVIQYRKGRWESSMSWFLHVVSEAITKDSQGRDGTIREKLKIKTIPSVIISK